MSQQIKYDSVSGSLWSVDLTTVRRESVSWQSRAENGEVGMSEFTLEDDDGTAGHSSDALVGHKTIRVYETSAHPSNSNILTGYVGDRRYQRSAENALLTGAAREIVVTVPDINAAANFEIFHDGDGDRPAETVDARIAWLLASGYIQAFDLGVVESSVVELDANNYDGQYPADVLSDCALKAGFNWWLYWDPAAQGTALGFIDANTSTLYSSDLRISNDIDDVDSGVDEGVGATNTYYPFRDAALTRSPLHTYSGVYLTWDGGATYRRNTATGSNFAWRDGPAPTASVKTSAKAITLADQELQFASTETDGITVSIVVLASEVNEVRAGHRLQVKFTHLPGYETWSWCRVLTKTVRQELRSDVYYIDLVLSPQCTGPGVLNFQQISKIPDTTLYEFNFTPTAGNLLIVCVAKRGGSNAASISGWTTVQNVGPAVVFHSMAVYARDATGAETSIDLGSDIGLHGYAYEIVGATVSDITSDQNFGTGDTWACDGVASAGGTVIGFFTLNNDAEGGSPGWAYSLTADADSFDISEDLDHDEFCPYIVLTRLTTDTAGTYAPEISISYAPGDTWTTEPPFWYGVGLAIDGSSSCR